MTGRGTHRRTITPKCSQCYKKHWRRWDSSGRAPHLMNWLNVQCWVTEKGAIKCKCGDCGNEWYSNGRVARATAKLKLKQENQCNMSRG